MGPPSAFQQGAEHLPRDRDFCEADVTPTATIQRIADLSEALETLRAA